MTVHAGLLLIRTTAMRAVRHSAPECGKEPPFLSFWFYKRLSLVKRG